MKLRPGTQLPTRRNGNHLPGLRSPVAIILFPWNWPEWDHQFKDLVNREYVIHCIKDEVVFTGSYSVSKGAAVLRAPGDSPNAGWIPLSKGIHREPYGRLIPPAKYQYTSEIYDIGTEILLLQ